MRQVRLAQELVAVMILMGHPSLSGPRGEVVVQTDLPRGTGFQGILTA
jgi:hypothetical protein